MLTTGQVSAGTASSHLCNVPPGPCLVVITNDSGSAGSAYVGLPSGGGTLSTANGTPVPAGQSLPFVGYPGSAGGSVSVIATTTATVGFAISSAQ